MDSPSFNQNSSNSIAHIADRLVQELHVENRLNNDKDIFSFIKNDEQEFEFTPLCIDSNPFETSPANMMYDEEISPRYPLFDQTLLQGVDINSTSKVVKIETESLTLAPPLTPTPATAPAPAPTLDSTLAPGSVLAQTSAPIPGSTSGRLSLMQLLIEDRNSASASSSDADDLDLLSPESFCVWTPRPTPSGKHKKSNSISIEVGNTSKKWNVRDALFKRSYSDEDYNVNASPVVFFLPPVSPKVPKKSNEKVSTKSEKNSKVGSNNKPENKLRPAYKGKIGNIRLPAYLPYRQDQIGVYGNGSEKNMYWY